VIVRIVLPNLFRLRGEESHMVICVPPVSMCCIYVVYVLAIHVSCVSVLRRYVLPLVGRLAAL
jgi:hypothetical protein